MTEYVGNKSYSSKASRLHGRGFTLVELLIVIVVIAILAAITIVAYGNVTVRARYSAMQSDLTSLNQAIVLYYEDTGAYPHSGTAGGNVTAGAGASMNIPGLVASGDITKIPSIPDDGLGGYYAYIWSANGVDYKLVRLVPTGTPLPAPEQSNPHPDTARTGRGWGYWSDGGGSL